MCDGMCALRKQKREEIEDKIRDLLASLTYNMSQQEFFAVKNEILSLIDEIE